MSKQPSWREVMAVAGRQRDLVRYEQLRALGLSEDAIRHRVQRGRLHRRHVGVYVVGRPRLDREGEWLAAVFACGRAALLSHGSAAALWRLGIEDREIEVSIPLPRTVSRPGIRVHRRSSLGAADADERDGIPVTSPTRTLIDLAARLHRGALERAISEADKLDLVSPEALRAALDRMPRTPGIGVLRRTLDRRTFRLTDSELERRFIPIALRAGLPLPLTGTRVNGYRVDFHWPDLGLVVETDGIRYHRTPAQQATDRRRDQAHTAAGLTQVRFTHDQIRYSPAEVESVLRPTAKRLASSRE